MKHLNALSQPEAIALHGVGGEGRECWNETRCPRKRSHYRNRKENNAKQRGQYHAEKIANESVEVKESIFILLQTPPVALLYLYRANRKDAPLQAIAFDLFQNGSKTVEVEPVHTLGWTATQVKQYIRDVLRSLSNHVGQEIAKFEAQVEHSPETYRIEDCPLHGVD